MLSERTLAAIRFGYGLPLPAGAAASPAAMLDALGGTDTMRRVYPAPGLAEVLPLLQQAADGRKMMRAEADMQEMFKAASEAAMAISAQAVRAGFARALDAQDGLRERLVAFWTDHFTTKPRNRPEYTLPRAMVEDAIRPNLTGRFGDLLVASVLHPAMLVYLDQVASVGPGSMFGQRRNRGLNENLAREVMELHTLGVGAGYGQNDVRQMAKLLTGLDATAEEGFVFRANRAEPGAETVLGVTYRGEGLGPIHAVLHDLAQRPETARHIARKLAVHFVSDTPDDALVAAMERTYTQTDGHLMAVYRTMLEHPAAWEPALHKARQPVDFILASLRALGLTGSDLMTLDDKVFRRMVLRPMALMGQPWGRPVGPDGWAEEAEHWITPQGLAVRIGWAMEVPSRLVRPLPDPRDFAVTALGDAADENLIWAVARAESVREGVGLVLASPAFNRR